MAVHGEGEGFLALFPLVGMEAREFLFILMSKLRQQQKNKMEKNGFVACTSEFVTSLHDGDGYELH